MKKLIMPVIAIALVFCASTAEAVIGSLSLAKRNLYDARMSAYNAKISYYNKASLYYTKKKAKLSSLKYALKGYSTPKVSAYRYTTSKGKSVAPTYSTYLKAAKSSSVSSLMSALKGWGK